MINRLLFGGLVLLLPMGTFGAQEYYSGLVLPFREVQLSSPVQSFITELNVREGAVVEEGQLLAQLYVRTEELDMERTAAALRKREFENRGAQNLFTDQLISEDEALAREIELQLARLQFEIAEEAVRLRQIRAPIPGIIVEREHEVGEMVTVGQPLFRLVDISSVYIRLFLSVDEARLFPPGGMVEVDFPELEPDSPRLRAVVDFVDPRVDSASGLLQVRVLAENPGRLVKPGLRSRVHLTGSSSPATQTD